MAVTDEARLGCGRSIDDVWETLDEPAAPHEQTCPYCQQARASLNHLALATTELREDDEENIQPARQLKTSVMHLVRAQVRRGQPVPLIVPEPDTPVTLTISEQAVLGVVWTVADTQPGIRARRCSVHPGDDREPGHPAAVRITLHVVVAASAYSSTLRSVDALRTRVAERVISQTGLDATAIDVIVEDLYSD